LGKSSIYRYSQWDNRFIIWNAGINSVIQKPILGVGQENFELIFPKNMHFRVDNAHNLFLETAVSSGLIGLFLYLLIICNSLKLAEFKIKLAIIAFLITGFFNPLNIVSIILFWILVGFSIKKS
jgi:O-antigen ligase